MDKDLEARVTKLEVRNRRVDLDKAWETSWTRKIVIAVLTYFVVASYLYFVIKINPWINAIVPTVGFLLSTLTIKYLKMQWIKNKQKEK
jgi:protein-S-isoprenylcysteine O-methyltransferase Ste14